MEGHRNAPLSLAKLTWAGWSLTVTTIAVMVGLMIPYGSWLYDFLPEGTYPALALALPVLILAFGFFAVGWLVLKGIGIPVWKQTPEQPVDSKNQEP
jgi:hypothetical protein